MSGQHLYGRSCYLGADPEVFVEKKGKIVPSFQFLPDKPIKGHRDNNPGEVARDGIQAELHPHQYTCRQSLTWSIGNCVKLLKDRLPEGAKINFATQNTIIPPAQFSKLSPDDRRLGCVASLNVYGAAPLRVNQDTYRRRSAGGHIHFGGLAFDTIAHDDGTIKQPTEKAVQFVKTLDAILANTCVLIDRDPGAVARRRLYGRAGEFRLPTNDRLEYRTLSNFWMRAIYLQSMVTGIGRQALSIVQQNDADMAKAVHYGGRWDAYGKLFEKLDEEKVRRAINTNNYKLAFENWLLVRDFIMNHTAAYSNGLGADRMTKFDTFLELVKKNGLDKYVPSDPIAHWSYQGLYGEKSPKGWRGGFESFIDSQKWGTFSE